MLSTMSADELMWPWPGVVPVPPSTAFFSAADGLIVDDPDGPLPPFPFEGVMFVGHLDAAGNFMWRLASGRPHGGPGPAHADMAQAPPARTEGRRRARDLLFHQCLHRDQGRRRSDRGPTGRAAGVVPLGFGCLALQDARSRAFCALVAMLTRFELVAADAWQRSAYLLSAA